MPETVDHLARSTADAAILKIEAHEERCAERWSESRKSHDALTVSVSALKGALIGGFRWMIGLVLGGMGTIILTLVVMLADKHK